MKPAPCASRNAKDFLMEATRLSAMGMDRFALTTTRNMGVDGSASWKRWCVSSVMGCFMFIL